MTSIWLIGALFTMSYLDTGFWKSIGCFIFWPVLLGEHFRSKEQWSNLEIHVMQQALFPDIDKPQWMAYLILYQLYPKLTYLSMDGYHCHGIADYSEGKMFYWQDRYMGGILNWTDKTLIVPLEKDFCGMTTEEIVNVWTELNGETDESKMTWLDNLKGTIK